MFKTIHLRAQVAVRPGMLSLCCAALIMLIVSPGALAQKTPVSGTVKAPVLQIVAAENFYGDVAHQIGGNYVQVSSILTNPNQDPHLFEASASTARSISNAQIVIYNGIGYDPWMERLLRVASTRQRRLINVASLAGHKPGDNPHIWYEIGTMTSLAQAVATELSLQDPAHASDYSARLAEFLNAQNSLQSTVDRLHKRYQGLAVSATEPVFGYMAKALGLDVQHAAFQWANMNGNEPAASDIVRMERDIRSRRVLALFYNEQSASSSAMRMRAIAKAAGVAVLGVSETMPEGEHYQAWMGRQLANVEHSLPQPQPQPQTQP